MKLPYPQAALPALALALLVGCSPAGQSATSPTPSLAASSTAASSSPTPDGPISCRLPVVGMNTAGVIPVGFIQLPGGTFQPDTTPGIVYDGASQRARTTQAPVLYGDSGATFDRPAGRWLPVAPAQVLADGSSYVYTREASPNQSLNEIHLVNVGSAADRIIYNGGAYDAIAYRPEGVYLVHHLNGTDGSNGLWLLDPATGGLKPYPSANPASWIAVAGGGAWSYSVDGNRFGSSTLLRLDLSSGSIATWFTAASSAQPPEPGSRVVRVIGFDPGQHPIIEIYASGGAAPEVWLVTSPSQATRVSGLRLGDYTPPPGVTDSHGAWVIGVDGVYLYRGSAFERTAAAPPGWTPNYSLGGACS